VVVPSDYSNWSQEPSVDFNAKKPLLYTHEGKPLTVGLQRIGYKVPDKPGSERQE
jgi:hypothetical protein